MRELRKLILGETVALPVGVALLLVSQVQIAALVREPVPA